MQRRYTITNYLPAILWSAFIFVICFLPGSSLPKEDWLDSIHFDKMVHAALYFILFFLMVRIFIQPDTTVFLRASLLCIAQGILIEIIQGSSLIQHRSFDLWDIAANIFGVGIAYITYLFFR